jgi:Brp/Blh family beta-carotene 15,15'-monooxygenase
MAVLLFSCVFPALALQWQFWPFVVGLIFLGLPHGALDHLAPLFILHKRLTVRYLAFFVLGYAALVLAYLVFWHVFPLAALVVFLLCSWLHWGQGDAYFLRVFDDQPAPSARPGRFLIWAVRGGLPIILPPLAHPQAFAQVAGGILGWYGGKSDWMLTGTERDAGFAVMFLAIAGYLWQSRTLSKNAFWRDAGEIALLLAYFLVVPAILAVGVYFCVWHSARHIARLMLLDDADRVPLALGQIGRCVLRSAREALPMTLGALGFLAGLFWWQGRTHVGVGGFVFLYLSLIAALTFPHFLLVLWMDREEFGQHSGDPVVVGGRGDFLGDGL